MGFGRRAARHRLQGTAHAPRADVSPPSPSIREARSARVQEVPARPRFDGWSSACAQDGTARLWRLKGEAPAKSGGVAAGKAPCGGGGQHSVSEIAAVRAEKWGCVTLGRLPFVNEHGESEAAPLLCTVRCNEGM